MKKEEIKPILSELGINSHFYSEDVKIEHFSLNCAGDNITLILLSDVSVYKEKDVSILQGDIKKKLKDVIGMLEAVETGGHFKLSTNEH